MVRIIKKYVGSRITIKGGEIYNVPEICQYCPHFKSCLEYYVELYNYFKKYEKKKFKSFNDFIEVFRDCAIFSWKKERTFEEIIDILQPFGKIRALITKVEKYLIYAEDYSRRDHFSGEIRKICFEKPPANIIKGSNRLKEGNCVEIEYEDEEPLMNGEIIKLIGVSKITIVSFKEDLDFLEDL
jgi:hypothetical protein